MPEDAHDIIEVLDSMPAVDVVGEILARTEGAALETITDSSGATWDRPNTALAGILSSPRDILALLDEVREARTQHSVTECSHLSDVILPRLRDGMMALYERHEALHICAKRYMQEWRDDLPAGWSLDELEAALDRDLPKLPQAIDPSAWFDRREEIEDWVVGCKPGLFAAAMVRIHELEEGFRLLRAPLENLVGCPGGEGVGEMDATMGEISRDFDFDAARKGYAATQALLKTQHLLRPMRVPVSAVALLPEEVVVRG